MEWSERYKKARQLLYGQKQAKDLENAFNLFHAEAEERNVLALHDLGMMHEKGFFTEADHSAAQRLYQQALDGFQYLESQTSNPYIEYRIGKMYETRKGVAPDMEQAIKYYQKSAEAGNQYAMLALGNLCYYHEAADYEKAFRYYSMAASQGSPLGYEMLGKLYQEGLGMPKSRKLARLNYEAALNLYLKIPGRELKASDAYRIGKLYENQACGKDMQSAVRYYVMAAQQENANAELALAKTYLFGRGVKKDTAMGMKYLESAITHGNQYAMAFRNFYQSSIPAAADCASQLMIRLARLMAPEPEPRLGAKIKVDRKVLAKIARKKRELGWRW